MAIIYKPTGKVARRCKRKYAAALHLIQFPVPDGRALALAAEVRHQCYSLKSDFAEADILHFTEKAATQIDGWK